MNLNTVKGLKGFFKSRKKELMKENLIFLLGFLSIDTISFFSVHKLFFWDPTNIFLNIIGFLVCLFSIGVLVLSSMISIYCLVKSLGVLLSIYDSNDLNLNKDNFTRLENYIDIKIILNLLLSTSLTLKSSSLNLNAIKEIETAFNYNQALLKTTSLENLPKEIRNKFNANLKIIYKINHITQIIYENNLTNNEEFISYLESNTIEEKIELLKKQEMVSNEKSNLEKQKEYQLNLESLEKQINENLTTSNVIKTIDETTVSVKDKIMAKSLSL
jgi:hypothetical protein